MSSGLTTPRSRPTSARPSTAPPKTYSLYDFTPGPGKYSTSHLFDMAAQVARKAKPSVSTTPRFHHNGGYIKRSEAPPPGKYNVTKQIDISKGKGVTISQRYDFGGYATNQLKNAKANPPPGRYNPQDPARPRSPVAGLGSKPLFGSYLYEGIKIKKDQPGPGRYSPEKTHELATESKSPLRRHTIAGRTTYDNYMVAAEKKGRENPGPGRYSPCQTGQEIGSSGVRLSFSSRLDQGSYLPAPVIRATTPTPRSSSASRPSTSSPLSLSRSTSALRGGRSSAASPPPTAAAAAAATTTMGTTVPTARALSFNMTSPVSAALSMHFALSPTSSAAAARLAATVTSSPSSSSSSSSSSSAIGSTTVPLPAATAPVPVQQVQEEEQLI